MKVKERRFTTWPKRQSSLAIFKVQTRAIGLTRQRTGGRGREVGIDKQSQSEVWSDWTLSQFLFGRRFQRSCYPESLSGRWSILRRLYC
jgi:hypothetical protein